MILRVIHNFFLYGLALIGFFWAVLFASCLMPFVKDRTRLFQAAGCIWVRSVIFFSGIKVAINGLENIPRRKSAILVANHQSAVDIAVLMAYPPARFRFFVKKELFSIPVFGWSMRQAGHIAVDRSENFSNYKTILKIIRLLKSGESILIFPEGTRSRDGALGKFKRGSLMIAFRAGAPIVPVAISGSYKIMPPGAKLIRPGKVRVSVGRPIYIENRKEYDRKLEEVRTAIAGMLSELP